MGVEERLDVILDEFPVDASSTEVVDVPGLVGARLYEVDLGSGLIPRDVGVDASYILDSEAGMTVACHPHLVGAELAELCLDCATDLWTSLRELGLIRGGCSILNILRGSSGYRVSETSPPGTPVISVRTEYSEDGYRAHSDDMRRVSVTYSDLDSRRLTGSSTLIIPDTFATGRSAEAALVHIFDGGIMPDKVVLFGFTAIPALERLGLLCAGWGVDLVSFSICDVTQLASNHYDMPVYGLDESLWESQGELRRLGSVVDEETLRRLIPRYVAGLDQPGDWSERHLDLFDGTGIVSGNVVGHLRKSIGLVESLVGLNSGQPWYDGWHGGIVEAELGRLREALRAYS